MSRQFDPIRVKYFDRTLLCNFAHQSSALIYLNGFITGRLPIHLADVKHFLTQTAFNMPRLSENQGIEYID